MSDTEAGLDLPSRLQRPAPLRQAPLRRPPLGLPAALGSALNQALGSGLDAARGSGAALGAGLGAAVQQGLDGSRAMAGAAEAGMQGFVERGVDTAYTVLEAYMRRGQQAAHRMSPGAPETAGPLSGLGGLGGLNGLNGLNGLGELGGLSSLGASLAGSQPWGATAASIAGPWLQLLRAWADVLATLGPLTGRAVAGLGDALPPGFMAAGAAAPAPFGTHQAAALASAAVAPPAATGPRTKVTVELVSRRSAEVSVSLEPGADLAALQADWLPPAAEPAQDAQDKQDAPGSLVLYSEPGHVHLRLTLADPTPAGRHEARLTDKQGQAWGNVVVTIAPRTAP